MVRYRPPRRTAAIQAHQQIVARRDRDGSIRQIGAAPPPRPVAPPPPPPDNCALCLTPVTARQDRESCVSCHRWFHYDCTKLRHGPMDRQCRGLCGLVITDPTQHLNQNPNSAYDINCFSCAQPFRDDTIDRWADVFRTRAWARYVRRRGNRYKRMQPTIPTTNQWWWHPTQFNANRPLRDWYLERRLPNSTHNIPVPERIVNPLTLIYSMIYNSHGVGPYRLHPAAWNWFQTNDIADSFGHDLRGPRFIVYPSDPVRPSGHIAQRYMFSELNYIMHSNRPAWRKFCRWFDDQTLPLAQM